MRADATGERRDGSMTETTRRADDKLTGLVAGAGALLLFAVMLLPWYRARATGLPRSAWQADWFVLALLLALVLAGVALAAVTATGRAIGLGTAAAVTAFGFVVTITVVVRLFIQRPGGNALTAVALGGYLGLAGINTIKGSAILMIASARRRRAAAAEADSVDATAGIGSGPGRGSNPKARRAG